MKNCHVETTSDLRTSSFNNGATLQSDADTEYHVQFRFLPWLLTIGYFDFTRKVTEGALWWKKVILGDDRKLYILEQDVNHWLAVLRGV